MMRSLLSTFVSVMLGAGLAFASAAQEVTGSLENQDVPVSKPSGTASGYPPTGGKGPGSGRSYQQGTAGPDQGSPNYRGGRGTEPAPTIDPATPDATQGAGPASVTPPPAIPGPYSNAPGTGSTHYRGRGYPYSGGRGHGYGRHQRGYGYGYPGYRGLGGGQYPHHRQFGNPPRYPAQPATSNPSTAAE